MPPQRISAATLKGWLSSDQPPLVVDVRDEDRFGGHVKGSVNFPSSQFDVSLPKLEKLAENSHKVVFYCMLSQQRGPTAAAKFARAVPTSDVYVLDGGFGNWASEYGNDSEMTESFIPSLYL